MLKIVITGPESTGKSTLASALSRHFNAVLSDEYAREYLETKLTLKKLEKNRENTPLYDEFDFNKMFLGQKKNEKVALQRAKDLHTFMICDTDALTYQIWYEEVFSKTDYGSVKEIDFLKKSKDFEEISSIYLLCSPEGIIWQPDPLRENPNDRDRLFDIYEKTLMAHQKTYFILRGPKNERLKTAIAIIKSFVHD